ncbi:Rep protein [Cyclovirus PKgoat21/PAK/2009]|uniref:Rep protein n=1 Tax=Cyclovirus PKgoat21/PAK/2009 TaxID=942033 RepID=UPI0001F6965F|nr:Rep protein [Cyclovirus PKgoat21/PAK/2009]ADU76995.1 Rep protein [Cyclovirus PKgoat21/PAK/2009]
MAPNKTLRRFCWTLNNYTEDDVDQLQKDLPELCKFAIFGREVCPTTGTKHLQGFCNLQRPKRFNNIREIFKGRAHIEGAKGSDQDNQRYCSKSGEVWSHGEPCNQGARSDLEEVVSIIKGGERDVKAVALQCPTAYIKYFKGIENYIRIYHATPERDFKTEVYFFWGPTGAGKSRTAREQALATGLRVYYKPRGDWWDGYNGHECVIFDDFYGWIKYDEVLKICDRYPYRVPVKGGYENFIAKKIWFTSNKPLEQIYKFIDYEPSAWRRRLTVEREFFYE